MAAKRQRSEAKVSNTWGGKREGAGRKPKDGRRSTPHRPREKHKASNPVHVIMRGRGEVRSLRRKAVFAEIQGAAARSLRKDFRVLHASVKGENVHLIVEAKDSGALTSGLRGFSVRAARAINRALDRAGPVWADRYDTHELATPAEVRAALSSVLMNLKPHKERGQTSSPAASRTSSRRTSSEAGEAPAPLYRPSQSAAAPPAPLLYNPSITVR